MLNVRNLVAGYGRTPVARLPALTLPSGQASLLMGPSGVGKTSLLLALAGLAKVFEGSAVIGDVDIAQLSAAKADAFRGAHIGFVFQDLHLVAGLSVLDNVLLAPFAAGRMQDRTRAMELLAQLDLAALAHRSAQRLSRGQAQRVSIARALLQSPRLILADEPTASLDDAACARVTALLIDGAQQAGAALLIATHDQRLRDKVEAVVQIEAIDSSGLAHPAKARAA